MVHKNVAEVSEITGAWQGTGTVQYPTMKENVGYVESFELVPLGEKPVIKYTQTTVHSVTKAPLHVEMGYMRLIGGDENNKRVELCITHPFGLYLLQNNTKQIDEVLTHTLHCCATNWHI